MFHLAVVSYEPEVERENVRVRSDVIARIEVNRELEWLTMKDTDRTRDLLYREATVASVSVYRACAVGDWRSQLTVEKNLLEAFPQTRHFRDVPSLLSKL